jgi:hypothetical protein
MTTNRTPTRTPPVREDYSSQSGLASWWQKDGAWHIAVAEEGRDGLFWTADAFDTRDQAIAALETRERAL